jgi:small-conductance mechanosensitive channel
MNDALEALRGVWPWAAALALGFPAALLVLNESIAAMDRNGSPLAGSLRWIRNWILPALVGVLFLRLVLGLDAAHLWVRLAATVLWILVAAGVLGVVNSVVFESARTGSWQQRVPRLLRDLVRVLLVAVAAAIVYSSVWGKDLSGALTALGVSSIVIGLALQEPLGNLFSGVMLLMERPFEVGDDIEIGGVSGVVKEINWRSAHLQSFGGLMRVIPNSTLNKETITNYSRPRRVRMEIIEIAFSYDDPPNTVRDALLEVASGTPGVLAKPGPIAATYAYGDSGITYRLIYRTEESDRWPVRNELMTRLWYMAKRHGLTMPYPVSVNLEYRQSGRFAKDPPDAGDLLAKFPRIPPVPEAEQATGLRSLSFGKEECVFDEGEVLEGVHLLVAGSISLQARGGGDSVEIAIIQPGEFFGEAGLYGPQHTEVRAVARTDSLVVIIAPGTVQRLFEESPALARETGHALDVRRRAAQSARGSRSGR